MKKILLLLFLLFTQCCSFAAEHKVFKLENGHTVIIKEVKNNRIVIIDTWIKTGSINETDQNNGVAHFLEHLFFKGTKNHPPGEFDKILGNKGAITNAGTSMDFTHYYIAIPSKDFDLALELHADMLLNPLIPRKELEMERKVVMEEMARDRNNPSSLAYENLIGMLYTRHPYGRKTLGTEKIISTITREEIMNFYNDYYHPSNMITVIVGDVNTEDALAKVKKDFFCNDKQPLKNVYPKEPALKEQKRKTAFFPVQTGYMMIGFRGTSINGADAFALDVLAAILGEGRSSALYQSVKEKKQLAYAVDAANSDLKEDGVFYIGANFVPGKEEKLEAAIFDEIKKIQENGVKPKQLNIAKNMIEHDTYYARESVYNIAREIGYTMATAGDIKFYENYITNIKKVSAADIKRVANKYLGVEKSAVSIILPEAAEKKTEHPVSYHSPGATPSVIVTPNDANDIIAVSILAKGGQFQEKIPGSAALASTVMMKGTGNYSAVELAQTLEDNGIKIMPQANPDVFTLKVLTTKKEYPKMLEILNEIVNNAVFSEYEIEKARTEKLSSIKQSRDTPLNLAVEEYKTLIYEDTPYSYSAKILEKNLPKISRNDILDYYNKIFFPQNLVISINGNIDEKQAQEDFGKIFNKPQGQTFSYSNYSIPALNSSKTVVREIKDLKTDWVILGWQAPGLLNKKDYATFEVIDAILGSDMSSRLYKNLRVNEGLAYQLGSQYSANILKGEFIVYIGTNPKNLTAAKQKLFDEVYRFKTEFVGTKELQEAKEKIIGQYIVSQETNLEKASSIGWYEASGRGRDFGKEYEKLINAVTVSDIIEAANKYFTDNYVISIVKPGAGK